MNNQNIWASHRLEEPESTWERDFSFTTNHESDENGEPWWYDEK